MDFESQFWAIINTPNYSNPSMKKYIDDELTLKEALMYGSLNEIEKILRETYGVTLSAQNDWERRCRQIVDVCLEQQEINVNMLDTKYSALLHFVIENLYEDFESVLLRCKDFDINALTAFDITWDVSLLHLAIEKGRKNIVKVLLEFGANVDVQDNDAATPLFYAANSAQIEIVEMLLKAGANVNARDCLNEMPINSVFRRNGYHYSCFNYGQKLYYSDLIKLLGKYGADFNFQNLNGTYSLLSTCEKGDLNDVLFMVKHGADLLASDQQGNTVIQSAARGNNYDLVDFLLRKGVDVNAKNNNNKSPIHNLANILNSLYFALVCSEYESFEFISFIWDLEYEAKVLKKSANMIEFLVDNGANVNTFNDQNCTPLMESVHLNSLEIVECLLELKADVNNRRDSTYYLIDSLVSDSVPVFRLNTDFYADRVNAWILLTAFLATKDCDISAYCDANSSNFEWVHPFFEQCKTQVNRMKERTICVNRSVTFFDFLTKDLMNVLQFCRNEEIMTVLKSGKHKQEFRLYKYLFERRMERVEKLQNCESAFRRFLDEYFKKKLPLVVVDEIINYLTAGNLRNFGRALCISKDFPDGKFYYSK